jgi:type IV pilus assembly protein PilW
MVFFWGEMLDPAGVSTALAAGEDCDSGLFDASNAFLFNNAHSGPTTLFDITADACPGKMGTVASSTSQLAIKRIAGAGITSGQTDGIVYLRSNGVAASFINDAQSVAPPAGFSDWVYMPAVYYIRNEGTLPRLCRLRLNGLAFNALAEDECLADGIEQIHVQFGIDTDTDGVANQYKSNPTAAEIGDAVTARIYVLARSTDPDPHYSNPKNYVLGDLAIAAQNDGFYRRVFSTTIFLRNPASLALIQ